MLRFLLRRAAILLAMLVVVSMVAFAIPYLQGGDPVRDIIRARVSDQNIDPAAVEGLRIQLGLDRPLAEQGGRRADRSSSAVELRLPEARGRVLRAGRLGSVRVAVHHRAALQLRRNR
jgi:hypothetical protein